MYNNNIKVLGIDNKLFFFYPMNSKYMEKNLDIMKPYCSEKASDLQLNYFKKLFCNNSNLLWCRCSWSIDELDASSSGTNGLPSWTGVFICH